MKTLTRTIRCTAFIASLLVSTTAMAQDEQPQTEVKTETVKVEVVQQNSREMTEQLLDELQRQLTDNIKQQANAALSAVAESVKALLP